MIIVLETREQRQTRSKRESWTVVAVKDIVIDISTQKTDNSIRTAEN